MRNINMETIFVFSIITILLIILFSIVGAIITSKLNQKDSYIKKNSIDKQLLEIAKTGNNSRTVTDFVNYFQENSPALYLIKENIYE